LLEEIDDGNTIFTWDEALNLMPEPGKCLGAEKINIDELEAEPNPEPIAESDLPSLEISPERSVARGMILADGTREASDVYLSEIVNPEEGWLVPVSASLPCKSYGRVLLPPKGQQFRGDSITVKPEMEIVERDEVLNEGPIDEPVAEFGYRGRDTEPQETELEGVGEEAREAVPDPEEASTDAEAGPFSRSRAILLLKALTVLVVLLLAVEAILYFI
jgi:hypothetical protein